MSKLLVVNADDFGFTHDVNEGILEAHRRGILTATTLMANGTAFEDAVRRAGEAPGLDIGVHLVLVSGRSVIDPERPLPATVAELIRAIAGRRIRVYEELAAQVRRVCDAGIRPTHLDTHKHTHLLPPVLEAVMRIAREFGIPWVRRPFDFPMTAAGAAWSQRAASAAFHLVRRRFSRRLAANGCRTTDSFAGFQITGCLRTEELVRLIAVLPEGLTELMTHPGRCTGELRAARTRLKESRERELEALTAAETRAALAEHGVKLARYRDL